MERKRRLIGSISDLATDTGRHALCQSPTRSRHHCSPSRSNLQHHQRKPLGSVVLEKRNFPTHHDARCRELLLLLGGACRTKTTLVTLQVKLLCKFLHQADTFRPTVFYTAKKRARKEPRRSFTRLLGSPLSMER
jgi:hypothetical protein